MAKRFPRWDQFSLRNQLTIVNVVLLAFSLIVAGTGTTLLLRPTLVGQMDANLRSIAADPSLVVGSEANTGQFTFEHIRNAPQPYYVAIVDESGRLLVDNWTGRPRSIAPDTSTIPFDLPADPDGPSYPIGEIHDGLGAPWRVVTVREDQYQADQVYGTLVVAMPLSSVNATMASFLAIFFGFGLSVLIFAAALTRLMVSATLQPLRKVEATAMAFAAGDYDQRLPESTPNTEVGRLSRALNSMLGRIDSALIERDRTISQMRRFVGDASHELRTPLVTVRGYAELYRMGALDSEEKVDSAMDRIEGEAKRMGGLVEDLLQLARLDEDREVPKDVIDLEPLAEDAAMDTMAQAPERTVSVRPVYVVTADDTEYDPGQSAFGHAGASEPLSANPLLESSDEDVATAEPEEQAPRERGARRRRLVQALTPRMPRMRRNAAATDDDLAVDDQRDASQAPASAPTPEIVEPAAMAQTDSYDEDEGDIPAMIYGNSDKVRQAIQNIVGNALRYTPEGSPLELGVVVDEPRKLAIIEVIDHGEGVTEEEQQKIFQRFWRADKSRARDTGGTGLGLAIVSAIMQAHEGTVDVVDTPGGGATFRLKFPLLTAPPVEDDYSA
ncbi:sensor histidine kinase [Gulosibacter molinativorax]|uniref:histidine kinase n=1 Tax=Gulosibacter molinativorax TaxID=256821 RepID=A0ABT7CA19_9MICO|nr:HAMP domain-containing sensor histidine kinase [Gulosibacter molinativorax]MDJ1372054.1 sensor histidine kinase [Gulosibacter molinativorax]QUY63897.1 Histidine kinase [Gulosibacter molinativorax]